MPEETASRSELSRRSLDHVRPFLPDGTEGHVTRILTGLPVLVRAVAPRQTKHGDHRYCTRRGFSVVTVNRCGNPWRFYITLLHELAHAEVTMTQGLRAPAHGRAWKSAFRRMLLDGLPLFPVDLRTLVFRYAANPLFSTDSDVQLSLALRAYDTLDQRPTLAEIPRGSRFRAGGRDIMTKHERVRKNYRCTAEDGRTYRVSPSARVEIVGTVDTVNLYWTSAAPGPSLDR